jgi:outer membrane lipoprotein
MNRYLRVTFLIGVFSFLLLSGCAHVVSKDLRARTDPTLTFRQVIQDPKAYIGKYVVWGGEIIQTTNQKDGTTLIEVFHRPLGWRGEPKDAGPSEGRFLVLVPKYLDPYLYEKGREVTVAGEIQGERIRPVGEMDYRYPVVRGDEIYVWREPYYAPYYGPYYRYHYYDPWWPSLMFRFHYFHH